MTEPRPSGQTASVPAGAPRAARFGVRTGARTGARPRGGLRVLAAAAALLAGPMAGPFGPFAAPFIAPFAAPLAAQGPGTAGAELLQMSAGTRAAALGGAYTAVSGDPDAVFYNPASAAWLGTGAGLGYQAYVQDITIGSFSGGVGAGPITVAAGLLFLDAGQIQEVVPDPVHGGERGVPTGEEFGATEAAGRLAAALPLAGGRAALGVALGFFTSDLAGASRSAAFLDAGAQLRLGDRVALGAAVRNVGTGLTSREFGDASLPAQARVGATARVPIAPLYGAVLFADGIWGIEEETAGLALGAEAGFLPDDGAFTAVLRAGAELGEGDGHLGRFRFGGGLSLGGLALDYTVQVFEYLGPIHRAGVRWTRVPTTARPASPR